MKMRKTNNNSSRLPRRCVIRRNLLVFVSSLTLLHHRLPLASAWSRGEGGEGLLLPEEHDQYYGTLQRGAGGRSSSSGGIGDYVQTVKRSHRGRFDHDHQDYDSEDATMAAGGSSSSNTSILDREQDKYHSSPHHGYTQTLQQHQQQQRNLGKGGKGTSSDDVDAPSCPPTRFLSSPTKKSSGKGNSRGKKSKMNRTTKKTKVTTKSCKTPTPTAVPTAFPTCSPTLSPTAAPTTLSSSKSGKGGSKGDGRGGGGGKNGGKKKKKKKKKKRVLKKKSGKGGSSKGKGGSKGSACSSRKSSKGSKSCGKGKGKGGSKGGSKSCVEEETIVPTIVTSTIPPTDPLLIDVQELVITEGLAACEGCGSDQTYTCTVPGIFEEFEGLPYTGIDASEIVDVTFTIVGNGCDDVAITTTLFFNGSEQGSYDQTPSDCDCNLGNQCTTQTITGNVNDYIIGGANSVSFSSSGGVDCIMEVIVTVTYRE